MNKNGTALSVFVVAVLFVLFIASGASAVTMEVSPSYIPVGSLYHGTRMVVSGDVAADEDIIVKFSSPEKAAEFRKKGKGGGLLWMNVGELEFKPVSDVYLLFSTREIPELLSEAQQDKYTLGYDSFRRMVEVSPVGDEAEKNKWIDEFLKFKEKNLTYRVVTGAIETEISGDRKTYSLSMDWPYQAPPQAYTVTVYAVKNNEVQGYSESALNVEKIGALAFISGIAFNKAPLYGVVSILIAIAAGFIVSVIFKGGGGSH